MKSCNSKLEFDKAKMIIPGGVNSPVRAFKNVGGDPIYIASGSGPTVQDIDGNKYIDYLGSWGPMILGHCDKTVVDAVKSSCDRGMSFGAPTIGETELATMITRLVPSVEMVRMVNSGTEATMSAVRLARGYTHRDLIVKFDGCYHGHGDSFLIAAGSGAATLGVPNSPGVTKGTAADTLIARYNDLESVKELFSLHKNRIAALIVEPVAGNMGVIPPNPGFLEGLRSITEEEGTLLIFDEVMTGFRVARGGAQELYNITPDLTTFGKIIGGGLPVGAYGGKREIMKEISPSGPIYQAGTLSGNPLATAAGLATLRKIEDTEFFYETLEKNSARLAEGFEENFKAVEIPAVVNRVGSMITFFFTSLKKIQNFEEASLTSSDLYGRFFHLLLEEGLYFAPSPFETGFISILHDEVIIEKTIEGHKRALKKLKKERSE